MKLHLLSLLLMTLLSFGNEAASFGTLKSMFQQAFMTEGAETAASLVYPADKMTFEIKAIFEHKVTGVELYPCSADDFALKGSGGHDWPAMPVAKLYIQTDGPSGRDFSDAYFTVGLVEGKAVLMAKTPFSSTPEWRRNLNTQQK